MKVTLIQMNIQWADPMANRAEAARLMDEACGSDLYLLPEMFSTGFATQPDGVAEEDEETLRWMKKQAHRRQAAILGSVAIKADDGSFRNRFYFVTPEGETQHYDKHHLFTYGGEHLHYTAGQERSIIQWRGLRWLPLICYDLRFPTYSRQQDPFYDVLIYVASWPASRQPVWQTLLQARAIENQCYVLGVNRIGTDPICTYQGGTQVIDAYGRVVASCPDNETTSLTIELNIDKQNTFRKKFPVLEDKD